MFTGIVTDVGEILALTPRETGIRLRIGTAYDVAGIDLGASIAHAGICLTVVEKGTTGNRNWFDVEASPETLAVTTMGSWQVGDRINLERSLTLGQEMGGHIVTGHVDGVAEIVERRDEGDMARFTFRVPVSHARFVAAKGSVALDGTSLTVNTVDRDTFSIMMIPHTLAVTSWGPKRAGDKVNFEVDLMARYAARLAETIA
ncbi:riboflavin synthase [Methyloraptor flagellatus]|jgi:riboflavin synthase|uniref:Riboflavin synthase n=1 Tax=Methyloraptor flagellatus TaxID=3162530 RepID=A0AAU7XHW1_9HYPH